MYDSINIVIPVYNEGENILTAFREIKEKIKAPCRIYIVYDFDEDNTIPVINSYIRENDNIVLMKNKYGKGVLNAIKTGFESIESGVVLVVMADLTDDLCNVDEMFRKVNEGYDIVCGSRYMKGGKQIGGPWFKKFLSKAAGVSLHYLAGLPTHDVTNSFKMYTKQVLNDIKIKSNGGFELGMELVVKAFAKGYKIAEVPSVWKDRIHGKSKFKLWEWLPKYIYWYLYAISNIDSIKKRYGRTPF